MVKILKDIPSTACASLVTLIAVVPTSTTKALSERRAASAKRYFTGKKVDPNRVITEGFGEDQPAAPNTSAAGMAKNRRVEFNFEFYIPSQPQP